MHRNFRNYTRIVSCTLSLRSFFARNDACFPRRHDTENIVTRYLGTQKSGTKNMRTIKGDSVNLVFCDVVLMGDIYQIP
jgi:hypothetical protein